MKKFNMSSCSTRRKKFVLVDPSFDGPAGDKWQYAVTFAKSAQRNGFEFVLLAARNSPSIVEAAGGQVTQLGIFDYAFYDHAKILERHVATLPRQLDRLRISRQRSWHRRIDREIERAIAHDDVGGEAHYRRLKAAFLRRAAIEARTAAERIALDDPIPTPFNRDDFAIALAGQLAKLELEAEDVLFFHTMTPAMLESLTEVTLHMGLERPLDVDAWFLFHFGKDAPDSRTFIDKYHSYSHMPTVTERLKTGAPFGRLHFLATCPELAEECAVLFGTPVALFEGLTDLETYFAANGGHAETEALKADLDRALREDGRFVVSLRAGDVKPGILRTLRDSALLLAKLGISMRVNILYHRGSLHLLREIIRDADGPLVEYLDVSDNADYIRALTNTHVILLLYDVHCYEKRVSAVLHDCSVLGTSCVVPARTTLATTRSFADIYVYEDIEDVSPLLVRCARWLRFGDAAVRASKCALARQKYGGDVVGRLIASTGVPSLNVEKRGPVAVVVMPAWGRCGSSFAMEAQVRYLMRAGFFVMQFFVLDKVTDQSDSTPFFWSLLDHNSRNIRAAIQRVAFASFDTIEALEEETGYLAASALDQLIARLAAGDSHDPVAERFAREAVVTVVNHVFNTGFARRVCGGRMILETHDIQSYLMVGWPLRNARTGLAEKLPDLINAELNAVRDYDYVVNVAPEEHRLLSLANRESRLVTPYIPLMQWGRFRKSYATVEQMARDLGLDPSYYGLDRFRMLLVGDGHPANRRAGAWFIERVFIPYLAPHDISLAIAGRLSDGLHKEFPGIGNVFYLSFVEDLDAVRKLSDICILPDQVGTGISIKTLETFATGMPFVATSVALRGMMDRLPADVVTNDEPESFGGRLLDLAMDASLRAEVAALARRCYDCVASERQFSDSWSEILRAVGIEPPSGVLTAFSEPVEAIQFEADHLRDTAVTILPKARRRSVAAKVRAR